MCRLRLAIARAIEAEDRDRAVEQFERVLAESSSRDRRLVAAEHLTALGVDVSSRAREAGFLVSWKLLGPFPEATADDLGELPFDPQVDLSKPVKVGDDEFEWIDHTTVDLEGIVDLTRLFDRTDHVTAYAVADIEAGDDGDATLKVGSDDGVAVWLNGERVHEHFVSRGIRVDQDVIPCRLKAGRNRLIVKVTQGGGGWGFCVRLAQEERDAPDG